MKATLTIILALMSLNVFSAVKVPSNWMQLDDEIQNESFKSDSKKLGELGEYVSQVYELQEETLNELVNTDKKVSSWKLAGYKTDLSLSYSGLLGFTSLKGKSAVELNWARVQKENSLLKNSPNEESEEANEINLSNTMTEEELLTQLEPVIRMAVDSGKVKNESRMRKSLRAKALEVHSYVSSLEKEVGSSWVPNKFRLGISFGISGELFTVVKLGADFRVRLEWAIKAHKGQNKSLKAKRSKHKGFVKLVSNLAKDMEKAAEEVEQKSGYKLSKISFGIGLKKKTIFGIAKGSGSAVGRIFFAKVKKSKSSQKASEDLEGSYQLVDSQNNNEKIFGKLFKRKRFRKGLAKSIKIADFFASKTKMKKGTHWAINAFKVNFDLSYSGIFGLTGTTGSSSAEIYFKK